LVVDEVIDLDQLQQTLLLLGQSLFLCKFEEEDVQGFFDVFELGLKGCEFILYLRSLVLQHRDYLLGIVCFVFVFLAHGNLLQNISILSIYGFYLLGEEGADDNG
jgi:hypothetical protein